MDSLKSLNLRSRDYMGAIDKPVYTVSLEVEFYDKEEAREFTNTLSWQCNSLTQEKKAPPPISDYASMAFNANPGDTDAD